MALDPLVFDTYKRYKAGTAKLVSFLASATRKTKLVDDLFPAILLAKGNGRLKGKARSAQRQIPKNQTYQIRTSDFVRMAEVISTSTNVKVSNALIRTLEEVIAARKERAGWFSSQQITIDESTQSSNEGHQHFIKILQKVHRILTSQTAAAAEKEKEAAETKDQLHSSTPVEDLSNIFECLELEDPAEWTSSSLPSNSNKTNTTYELEPSDEDLSFAIFCLFKDLTDIRHYVRQTWAEYREKQIAFTTAAVTMNTAIALFRRLNDDFVSDFPQFDEHKKIIKFLYTSYCDPYNGTSEDFAAYNATNFRIPSKIFFCDHTFELLGGWFLGGAELPFYRPDPRLKLTKDEEVSLKCLSLLGLIAHQFGETHIFTEDQLIKAILVTQKDRRIYTWVVFAIQIFVDTRLVVDKELDRCIQEFHRLQQWMSSTTKQTLKFGETNNVNNWYVLSSKQLLEWNTAMENVCKKDWVQNLLSGYFEDRAGQYSWGSFFLYRNNTMLPGLLMQRFLTELHKYSVGCGGDQASIMTTIHLYNSTHQVGSMPRSKEWTDLEKLINWQGSSWIFVGERPTNASGCFSHLGLVMGVSTIALSRNRRGKGSYNFGARGLPHSPKKSRKLRPISRYAELGCSGFNDGRPGCRRGTPTKASGDPLVMLEMIVAKDLEDKLNPIKNLTSKTSKFSQQPRLTPLAMLSILKECFKAEEAIFRFDMFKMNERCVKLLRRIQKVCVEQSPSDYNDYEGDRNLNECFSHMVAGVLGLERHQPTRFKETCDMLEEIVDAEGSAEFDKAKGRCFIEGDGTKKVTDDFKTPFTDNILFSDRDMFSHIFIQDRDGGFTIL